MNKLIQAQQTNSIIMVRPDDFGYNQQTGADNAFQHKPDSSQAKNITDLALNEFSDMVEILLKSHINVLVIENKQPSEKLPDAVFPNNWFSTRSDGTLFIYPMKTANRQAEVNIPLLLKKLKDNHFIVNELVDLRAQLTKQSFLEGTGSLIFHHPTNKIFASYSERCHQQALSEFTKFFSYQPIAFESKTKSGESIYHTNVLMSCGDNFSVICEEVMLKSVQSSKALSELYQTVNDVIIITEQQMAENFCGNIIQLKDINNQNCIVLSESAYKGFTPSQINQLENHGNLIICRIPTIEFVGGGSARCMIAENFLPMKN